MLFNCCGMARLRGLPGAGRMARERCLAERLEKRARGLLPLKNHVAFRRYAAACMREAQPRAGGLRGRFASAAACALF